jgi:hypothetical protein
MNISEEYKKEQLLKQEQKERLCAANSTAFSLFMQECARSGLPRDEEETNKLIERCFIVSCATQDYLHKQLEPFI